MLSVDFGLIANDGRGGQLTDIVPLGPVHKYLEYSVISIP